MASIKLSIAEPCHENWNAMLPEEKGRFCLSCQKTVVDFTAMSDRQVFDYFKNYKGDTCGQLSNDQLNRELTKPKTHSIGRWKYFWQILLPAFFAFQKLDAQPRLRGRVAATPIKKPVQEEAPPVIMGMMLASPIAKTVNAKIIAGKIIDDSKEALPYASISSSDGKYTVADSAGNFRMALAQKATLTISHVGYIQTTFTADSLQTDKISALKFENGQVVIETTIELKPTLLNTPNIVINGFTGTVCSFRVGGITSVKSRTFFKNQKLIMPANDTPQLKIFPNPIQPGQNFQIAFQVKKTGNYLLRITDAAGKVVAEEELNVSAKDIKETINGQALQQLGIYFISVSDPVEKKRKALNGRILVQ